MLFASLLRHIAMPPTVVSLPSHPAACPSRPWTRRFPNRPPDGVLTVCRSGPTVSKIRLGPAWALKESDPAAAVAEADRIIARLSPKDENVPWAHLLRGAYALDRGMGERARGDLGRRGTIRPQSTPATRSAGSTPARSDPKPPKIFCIISGVIYDQ
jgi:hypothetical protein